MKFSFSCAKPPSTGDGEVSFNGSTAYSSRVNVKTVVNGKPETMQMQSSGRWVAADCGTVKPPALPKTLAPAEGNPAGLSRAGRRWPSHAHHRAAGVDGRLEIALMPMDSVSSA